jgi:N-acetylmuramoyl-L-alanine amidase
MLSCLSSNTTRGEAVVVWGRGMKWLLGVMAVAGLLAGVWAWGGATGREAAVSAQLGAAKDDLHLLAQVVCAEASGEPYEGKVAVAAVLLNRTRDPRFPDSVAGVVYQPHALPSVGRGALHRGVTAACLKAARAALSGWDPSGGALYFFPAQTGRTGHGMIETRRIGQYVFAR